MASNNSNSNMTMMEDGHNGSAGIQRAAEGSEAVHVQITPSSSPSKKLATYYEDDEEDLPLGFGSMITEVGEMQEVRDTAEEHARQENATASPQLSHSDTAVDSANSDGMSSTERNSETGERDSSDGKDPIVSVDEQQRLDDEDAFERAWSTHEVRREDRRGKLADRKRERKEGTHLCAVVCDFLPVYSLGSASQCLPLIVSFCCSRRCLICALPFVLLAFLSLEPLLSVSLSLLSLFSVVFLLFLPFRLFPLCLLSLLLRTPTLALISSLSHIPPYCLLSFSNCSRTVQNGDQLSSGSTSSKR